MIKLGKFKQAAPTNEFEHAKHGAEYYQAELKLHLPYLEARCAQHAQEEAGGTKRKLLHLEKLCGKLHNGMSSAVSEHWEIERAAPYSRKRRAIGPLHHVRMRFCQVLAKNLQYRHRYETSLRKVLDLPKEACSCQEWRGSKESCLACMPGSINQSCGVKVHVDR